MVRIAGSGRVRLVNRAMLVCGVSFAALLGVSPAFAGEAGQDGSTPGDEVVVTGSRLRLNGMMTPTPVTVVGADELKAMAPVTMIEAVSQLPQFYANQAPGSTANFFTRGGLGNLNIRGLGINRTLTLLNGRRVVSANAFGGVDISLFPSDMIKSVETVTGGASAAYGTDAVAGVTNFILDTKFTGARLTVQGGETSRSDAANYTVTGAVGFRIGDRGHLLVSGEYFRQDGVNGYQDRDWYQGWGTVPDATGKLLIRPNVVSRNTSYDGMAILAGSALNGLVFRRDGTTFPFVTSDLSSGALGTPAARQSITNGGSGEDIGGSEPTTIYPKLSRKNGFAYADYALTKDLTVFAQYMHGETTDFALNRAGLFGQATAVTIFRDNAYLPQSVQNIMVAENRASFTFKRTGSILDLNKDMSLSDKSVLNSVTTGFNWKIDRPGGLFNGWAVDGYYQYGHNFHRAAQVGFRVDRIFAAIDAVKDPSGKIVCRTSLFNNQFPGCQPLNLFGRGNASAAAVDYVIGFEPGQQVTTPVYYADTGFARGETDSYTSEAAKVTNATMKQNVAELSANASLREQYLSV